MFSKKRILICPLDWGLGHATRCIPIIRLLLQKNAEVIIAAEGRPMELLKKEFPDLGFICLKGYGINYPDKGSMVLKMLFSIPKIFFGIYKEHIAIKKIIQEKNIDIIISDNRFGLWDKKIKSVFITHQIMIKAPVGEALLRRINLYFINKYDECWVPDFAGENNLSGDLSHKYSLPENTFFIGAISRFNVIASPAFSSRACGKTISPFNDKKYDIMTIISGPEPQRSIFEKLILEQLKQSNLKALVILGKTELEQKNETFGNIEIVSYLKAEEMQNAILDTKIIIARSGYSTIMDLATLGKKAIFIPTPGQTEQEYLAEYLMKKNITYCISQDHFS
ncbi:MAG: glycosyltransferase, partial [Bacteroidetes bacterium]|nr:glycosyltransferase [Bacteroidota bacterium]